MSVCDCVCDCDCECEMNARAWQSQWERLSRAAKPSPPSPLRPFFNSAPLPTRPLTNLAPLALDLVDLGRFKKIFKIVPVFPNKLKMSLPPDSSLGPVNLKLLLDQKKITRQSVVNGLFLPDEIIKNTKKHT